MTEHKHRVALEFALSKGLPAAEFVALTDAVERERVVEVLDSWAETPRFCTDDGHVFPIVTQGGGPAARAAAAKVIESGEVGP